MVPNVTIFQYVTGDRVQRMFTFRSHDFAICRTIFVFQLDGQAEVVAVTGSSDLRIWVMSKAILGTDIPAATKFQSPRNLMNNGATAVVAYDCSGCMLRRTNDQAVKIRARAP